MICTRCQKETLSHILSIFNLDELCLACKKDEEGCPNYNVARAAEEASVRRSEFNFPGIGLAPEDQDWINLRINARRS